MIIYQGSPAESYVQILDGGGSPINGLLHTDFAISYKRTDDTSFLTKTLDENSIYGFGDGFYAIKWSSDEVSKLGSLVFKVASSGATPFSTFYSFADIIAQTVGSISNPDLCILTGNIRDFGGLPAYGISIVLNPVSTPIVHQTFLLASTQLTTYPDAHGNFSVALLRNVEARVRIDGVGVNHKITVPDQETALLKDLLPIP